MKKTVKSKSLPVWKYLLTRDAIFATIAVFVVMGLLSRIPINTHILDPFKLALRDFNYNDLVYSKMGKNKDFKVDTNMVIVNIGTADREAIALMIDKVSAGKPAVIGVDVLFNVAKTAEADTMLHNRFSNNPKLVMAYKLEENGEGFKPEGYFYATGKNRGFANFVGEEEGVIRYIKPTLAVNDTTYDSFAAAVLKKANPEAYANLVARGEKYEIINYRRTAEKYIVEDGVALINGSVNPATFKDKIVLLGYVSATSNDIEDKHYTPFNPLLTGRGTPDMNGIFIHSNVIGMALDNDLIHQTPAWLNWLIAFLICWIHVSFFIKYYLELHVWFHLIAKFVQIAMAVIFVYLGLWAFNNFNTQINMTATLAAVILAVDVLYFYQSFAVWLSKRIHYKTIFNHDTAH